MRVRIAGAILLTVITVACIHKQSGPVSPWERVNVNMAGLAQINDAVAKGVIAVQQTGSMTVQQATPTCCQGSCGDREHSGFRVGASR